MRSFSRDRRIDARPREARPGAGDPRRARGRPLAHVRPRDDAHAGPVPRPRRRHELHLAERVPPLPLGRTDRDRRTLRRAGRRAGRRLPRDRDLRRERPARSQGDDRAPRPADDRPQLFTERSGRRRAHARAVAGAARDAGGHPLLRSARVVRAGRRLAAGAQVVLRDRAHPRGDRRDGRDLCARPRADRARQEGDGDRGDLPRGGLAARPRLRVGSG